MTVTASPGVVAWENENADLTVWGTHDPDEALPAIDIVYTLDSGFVRGSREYRQSMPTREQLEGALRRWAAPELLDHEGPWEDWQFGEEPQAGWVPYLLLIR